MLECPLCGLANRSLITSPLVSAIADLHPISDGHTLVVPDRHVESYFELDAAEQAAIWAAVGELRTHLDATLVPAPDGYNVGFNVSAAAGQTVAHAHVHVIPRYHGDVSNPRGGVRGVIPERADWTLDLGAATPIDGTDVAAGPERPLSPWLLADLSNAVTIDICVAFVWPSGLDRILSRIADCLDRGGTVRFLTGDYQGLTAPDALRMLLDLADCERLHVRIVETGRIGSSFHPKAYLVSNGASAGTIAYVGSSNLSEQALTTGHEWNVRLHGVAGVRRAQLAFDRLFLSDATAEVTDAWIDAYERRREAQRGQRGTADEFVFDEPPRAPFEPHAIQREALAALAETRVAGNRSGLVVLATGLGKTWLAAFDSRPFTRVLFVAHREEILRQAMHTFRSIRPRDRFGLYTGDHKHTHANVLFASIQTFSNEAHRGQFDSRYFDYIIVDEFHHAAANTYRSLIQQFEPKFLLGLTATPDRSDGGDLLDLCAGNLVYRCDLGRGIRGEHLSPFHYHGVPDLVDYANIPWRSRRFDPDQLSAAVETSARAQNALEQWRLYAGPGSRTLGFCVSRSHADFMREFFTAAGLRAAAVHSHAPTSDPREHSLEQLERGELDVLFTVDMFNEGLDIKNVDAVLMLRPTESRILWLQQIGRGLRKAPGKQQLQIIDYIGNHRIFLQKPAALFGALGLEFGSPSQIPQALRQQTFVDSLPPGCAVTYELEAIELLERLFPTVQTRELDALVEWYRAFEQRNGVRPTALQALRAGRDPRAVQAIHGSWLAFVESEGGLDEPAKLARARNVGFLRELELMGSSPIDRLLLIEALVGLGGVARATTLDSLGPAFVRSCSRSTARRHDIVVDLDDVTAVRHLLVEQLIAAWVERPLGCFVFDGEQLRPGPGLHSSETADEATALDRLVLEIVDWRVAQSLAKKAAGVRFRVKQDKHGTPLLEIDRRRHDLPSQGSWAPIQIEGLRYRAKFGQARIELATSPDSPDTNLLPELLRGLFGADAGASGTRYDVAQNPDPSGGYRWSRAPELIGNVSEGKAPRREDGTEIDARLQTEELDGAPTVVVMSRGGQRNNEYSQAVELLLERLAELGASIDRVAVESGATRTLDLDARTLELPSFAYPIRVEQVDVRGLRSAIAKAVAAIGRLPDAKGSGNSTKRVRVWVGNVDVVALDAAIFGVAPIEQ